MTMLTLFAFIGLISAGLVIGCKNPIHSILCLGLVFVIGTFLLLILNIEFIAMLFLVVYIGAISVLFLFVVMMLNIKIVELNEKFLRYLPIGLIIGIIFLIEILSTILNNILPNSSDINNYIYIYSGYLYQDMLEFNKFFLFLFFENLNYAINIQSIGNLLYDDYVYPFILAGMILFVAMVGAIVLTLNQHFLNKRQDIHFQSTQSIHNSINLIY